MPEEVAALKQKLKSRSQADVSEAIRVLRSRTWAFDGSLQNTDLKSAIFPGADLAGFDLTGANLTDADCTNALLYEILLEDAVLLRTQLRTEY